MLKANCDLHWGMILIEGKPLKIKAHFPIGDRSKQTHLCIGGRPSTLDLRRSPCWEFGGIMGQWYSVKNWENEDFGYIRRCTRLFKKKMPERLGIKPRFSFRVQKYGDNT